MSQLSGINRIPAEIHLEIIGHLARFRTPSTLYSYLAACPAAALAHAEHPQSLDTRISARIARCSKRIQAYRLFRDIDRQIKIRKGWERFRRELDNRYALWRLHVYFRRRSKRVKRKVTRYGF